MRWRGHASWWCVSIDLGDLSRCIVLASVVLCIMGCSCQNSANSNVYAPWNSLWYMRTHMWYKLLALSFFVLIFFVEIFIEIEFVAQRPLAYCNFTMFYLFICRRGEKLLDSHCKPLLLSLSDCHYAVIILSLRLAYEWLSLPNVHSLIIHQLFSSGIRV